jgi:hypothetical protein
MEMEMKPNDKAIEEILAERQPKPVVICGWCPDVRQRTLILVQQGKIVSHGMCKVCQAKMEGQIAEGR